MISSDRLPAFPRRKLHAYSPIISFSYPTVATTFTLAPELEKNSKRQLRESIRYNVGVLVEEILQEMILMEEGLNLPYRFLEEGADIALE